MDSHSTFAVFFIPFMRGQTEYSAIAAGRVLWVCVLSPWCYSSALCDSQALAAEAVIHELPE